MCAQMSRGHMSKRSHVKAVTCHEGGRGHMSKRSHVTKADAVTCHEGGRGHMSRYHSIITLMVTCHNSTHI